MTVLERAHDSFSDDARAAEARWHCVVDHTAAATYVALLGVDPPMMAGQVDEYAGRALGSHLLTLVASRTVPGDRRPPGLLPTAALGDHLARAWRAHWSQEGGMPDPDQHLGLLRASVQRLGDVLAAAREPARRRWPGSRAETVSRGAANRWCALEPGVPDAAEPLAEMADEFAARRELVVAAARRKLRSLSEPHERLIDDLLVTAAGREAPPPVPAAVECAYVTVRLTRRGDEGLFRDLPGTEGMPWVTKPEHVAHLRRITGVQKRLDDPGWLEARAFDYVRWGDERVRHALAGGAVVASACRSTGWSEPDRLTYSLLRLTQKRDRADYYGIRLEDPWLGRVLTGRAEELATNLRKWAPTVDAIASGEAAESRWLAEVLRREYASSTDRDEAVSNAYVKIAETLRGAPLPAEAREETARSTSPATLAEYVFQSNFEHWCKSVRASQLDELRPDDDATPDAGDDPAEARPPESDPVLERLAADTLELLQMPYDLQCASPDPESCDGTCLAARLRQASASELRHRLEAFVGDAQALVAEEVARWRAQRARVLALSELERDRLPDLVEHLQSLPPNRQSSVGRLSLWTQAVRACARRRLRALDAARDDPRALWDLDLPPLADDAAIRELTGAPNEANVRQARLNFLAALQHHDPELAVVYRWLRSGATPEFEWLRRPALAAALEPYLRAELDGRG